MFSRGIQLYFFRQKFIRAKINTMQACSNMPAAPDCFLVVGLLFLCFCFVVVVVGVFCCFFVCLLLFFVVVVVVLFWGGSRLVIAGVLVECVVLFL